jgi:hypothetical protein
MSGSERNENDVAPSEQRGGATPTDAEAKAKGEWAATAQDGVVPPEQGGSDAPGELQAEDPDLGSSVLGKTTGSDEPATRDGVDLSAGDNADATTDGGPETPTDAEPDLRDAAAGPRQTDLDSRS